MLCRCGGLKFALGSVGVGLVVISWIERQQFGTQMPQGGHPPHHSITSSARASRGLAPMGWQDYKADGAIREGAGER